MFAKPHGFDAFFILLFAKIIMRQILTFVWSNYILLKGYLIRGRRLSDPED